MIDKMILKYKINKYGLGLALGGGAARGFFHIGVLQALEEYNIPISYIAGISIGSLVGGLYAYGYKANEVLEILSEHTQPLSLISSASISFKDQKGIFSGKTMIETINQLVKNTPIESLKIPFSCRAVDVESFSEVILDKGDTGYAIKASCSIPGIFTPEKNEDDTGMLIDGGVLGPVPFALLRNKFKGPMLASNLIAYGDLTQKEMVSFSKNLAKNMLHKIIPATEIVTRSFYLIQSYVSELEVEKYKPELYIEFTGTYDPSFSNIADIKDQLVYDGYKEANKILRKIF